MIIMIGLEKKHTFFSILRKLKYLTSVLIFQIVCDKYNSNYKLFTIIGNFEKNWEVFGDPFL